MEVQPIQVVVAGGAAGMRRAIADELQRSARIAVVGVLDAVDHALTGDHERVVVLDVTGQADIDGVLSSREVEVLRCLARGMTNSAAATELYISPETVKTHVRNLLRKLRVNDREAAVVRASQVGLI